MKQPGTGRSLRVPIVVVGVETGGRVDAGAGGEAAMSGQWGPAVRVEVLGPLRAWRGDTLVSLGPVQQRVVLAVLAAHANRALGREQLINAVWGSAAPAYAV